MSSTQIVEALSWVLLQSDIRHDKERGEFPTLGEDFDFLTTALCRCRDSRSQLAQDLWVLYELRDKRRGFFVEFGAGDGMTLSNTWLLETQFDWSGILAEPLPQFEPALRTNRKARIVTRCITGSSLGPASFIEAPDPLLSSLEHYAYDDKHAGARRSGLRVEVLTQSLGDLLRDARAPRHIDYLSIDTEGNEYDILEAFDFSKYEISLMTIEHNHTAHQKKLDDLLVGKGFVRKFAHLSDFDAWYVNPGLIHPKNSTDSGRSNFLQKDHWVSFVSWLLGRLSVRGD